LLTCIRGLTALSRLTFAAVVLILVGSPCRAIDPESPEVRRAIDRAVGYLRGHVDSMEDHEAGIVAYALIRAGESPESEVVKGLVRRVFENKFKGATYGKDTPHQFYESGCDMMMFEAANPGRYKRQIDIIAAFAVENQWPSGSWNYYGQSEHGGDTSHTQYAVLGLWAAARAGVRIPVNVWTRIAEWHLKTQFSDGGFAYHPAEVKKPTQPMTVNGVASLCIARMMLFPNRSFPPVFDDVKDEGTKSNEKTAGGAREEDKSAEPDPAAARPLVLEPLDLSGTRVTDRSRRGRGGNSGGGSKTELVRINRGISRGANWIRSNYGQREARFPLYYLYGLERMCALAKIEKFDDHDWYAEHAAAVFRKQRPDGSFDGECGVPAETSFAILFLARATRKLLAPQDPGFGGGLMVGGRGLPSNLGAIRTSSDGIQVRKLDAPVDKLLSELENPKSAEVESVQQAIVETVEIGDREKLVGQKDRLKRLARDPRPEVRRTALWALGRCATVRDALVLIKGLDDPDVNVVIEANNALCWLSRRPSGFGRPSDPVADLPENASERQRRDAAQAWRNQVRRDWREWFNQVGPYSERELPIDLPETASPKK
jgi:hypothetical protein